MTNTEDLELVATTKRYGDTIAVDAINSAPEFLASKKLIMAGAQLAPETLSDTSQSMKEIAAAAV